MITVMIRVRVRVGHPRGSCQGQEVSVRVRCAGQGVGGCILVYVARIVEEHVYKAPHLARLDHLDDVPGRGRAGSGRRWGMRARAREG